MPSIETVRDWPGRVLVDRDSVRVGEIQEIYLDARTDQPEWALVNTGLFGTKSSFVPILDAEPDGQDVRVPFDKGQIKDAPSVEPDGELSEYEESELYRHYGMAYDEGNGELAARPEGTAAAGRGGCRGDLAGAGPERLGRTRDARAGRDRAAAAPLDRHRVRGPLRRR